MPDCCAAAECKQSSEQSQVSFFRFPLDPERCKQWIGNCRRPDLKTKTPEYLHRHFKLCSRHFEASMIQKESELKTVLKDGAVPTIFDFTAKKGKAQSGSRKRTRQQQQQPSPAASAPVEAKKAKGDTEADAAKQTVIETPLPEPEQIVILDPVPLEPEPEDPATTKAKEILKVHFKETLAYSGFSLGNSTALNATKSLGGVDPVCAEKIEPKEVLKLGEEVMREEIRNSLRTARFFSILFQDKAIVDGKEQIPVFIRTVSNDGFPVKHLLGFLPCDLDSDSLFVMLLSEIRNKWGLRMEHCRGFTYLTSGGLCQKLKLFSYRMLKEFPQVVLAPSDPYAFNMWLIRTLPVLSIQDVVDTVEEVAAILRRSDTLMRKLHFKIAAAYSHIKGEVDRVKEACQNNWEYGTDAFQTMLDILEPLLHSIGEMCTSTLSEVDTAIVESLLRLREKLRNFNFIVTLVILKHTLCCVSILNPSLRGIISISSTLQYTISNALKLLNKHLQEIPIFHRKWFSDAVGRAKKLGVAVTLPLDAAANGEADPKPQPSPEDYYRETLSKMILEYLIDEVKRVLGTEMVRILRWLSLVPSYMADHNFSIRKDKVADANLNNLARPDTFYEELGCWEVKWRHASKRRILPTGVFATLKIPDIGFYPNVQSLLRVLGSIPCINAEVDVYAQYDMVLHRCHSYMREVPAEKRLGNMAFVYVNQDVHFNIDDMVQSYVKSRPDVLQLLCQEEVMEVQPSGTENNANDASKEDAEEPQEMILDMQAERPKAADCAGADKEALKSALKAAVTAAYESQSKRSEGGQECEVEYVTKSEMNEVLKVCEGVVCEGILSEAGNSFFSLFIDRTVQFGEADFLPVFVRFVDSFDVMRLELMGFVEAGLDTEDMCQRLSDLVTTEWRLDLKYCRGQAYLGSGEVWHKLKAFARKVQEKYPLAICTHCSCYSFNTWWSRSVPVSAISRTLDTLERIMLFFASAPELEKQLDQVIAVGLRESYEKVHELQGNFCTSWLEKHDSYEAFVQILEPLVHCLESFQSSNTQMWSLPVINQAKKLLHLIRDFDFIMATVTLKNVSSFTRELSAALQKDHFGAASQLCQISGIVASLNRLKTNIKVFHQNWFEEACALAQSLGVQVKVPDSVTVPRDSLLKPAGYYKDAVSVPLVDHLISFVKDHFSDDHKEALNFLSLVPCSVTMSYTLDSLKSKPPLYVGDLPDPDNFFTELSCWKVKWKTKVVSPTIPDTIFQTLRLPLMQYFSNINTLLKIMSVLPSTTLEHCGEVNRHKVFQEYLRSTYAKDRTPCLAMLRVGTNFNRDLDRMVMQCLKVTPKTLEGICLDNEAKTIMRNSEVKNQDNHTDGMEEMEIQQDQPAKILPDFNAIKAEDNHRPAAEETQTQQASSGVTEGVTEVQAMEEKVDAGQLSDSLLTVFKVAARLSRRNRRLSELPKEDQDLVVQELGVCSWDLGSAQGLSDADLLESLCKSVRDAVICDVQESPFFSIITDKVVSVGDESFVPVFVRFVDESTPKVELLGFLALSGSSDADAQAKALSGVLSEEWGLNMGCCRGQSFMCTGAANQGLRKMSLDFLASYPLAINTPSESCGLAYWLAVSLHNDPITKVLGVVEDLLHFFDQSPRLHIELCKTREGLLNTPREALAEVPETCLSRWKRTEDFFDILVDMLEGVLTCLDSVSNNTNGLWSNSMSIQALMLSTAIRESDFVISLVILKNACAPVRDCSTVFRCGNPADIICELERIPLIIDVLGKTLENICTVHKSWFEEATRLASRVAGALSYPDTMSHYESPEAGYRETVSRPVLQGLIDEMKFNFSECHLRALRVLSLLPTCNPLPLLPEATDKLYAIYQSDLPDPDAAEEEINAWAAVWRDKYQDAPPPASISETLNHPEAKGHPNVTALLRLVAVLPSISMEFDQMKTTFNSLRILVGRDDVVTRGGSKTNSVMLLMHRRVLQTLSDLIEKCVETDPKSCDTLSQVRQLIGEMKMDDEVCGVASEECTNVIGLEDFNGPAPVNAQDEPKMTPPDLDDVRTSAIDDNDVPREDGIMGTTDFQPASQPLTSTSDQAQDVTTENMPSLQDAGTEAVTEAQVAAAEPLVETTQSVIPELVAEVPDEQVSTEQGVSETLQTPGVAMEQAVERVEPVATIEPQDVTTEPIMPSNDVPMEVAPETQGDSIMESDRASSDVAMEHTATTQDAESVATMEVQGATAEPVTEVPDLETQTKPASAENLEMAAPSISADVEVQCVVAEEAKRLNDVKAAVQGVAKEPVQEVAPHGVAAGLITAAKDVSPTSNGIAEEQTVTKEHVLASPDVAAEQLEGGKDINKDPDAAATEFLDVNVEPAEAPSQDVAVKRSSAAQDVIADPAEIAPELMDVTVEPADAASQGVPSKPVAAAQHVTTEPCPEPEETQISHKGTAEPCPETQDVQTAHKGTAEPCPEAQDVQTAHKGTAELCPETQNVQTSHKGTTEPCQEPHDIQTSNQGTAEPGTTAQDIQTAHKGTVEPGAAAQGVHIGTAEPRDVQTALEGTSEPCPEPQDIQKAIQGTAEPSTTAQDIQTTNQVSVETDTTAQDIQTAHKGFAEPGTAAQDVQTAHEGTSEPCPEPHDIQTVNKGTTELGAAAQDIQTAQEGTAEPQDVQRAHEGTAEPQDVQRAHEGTAEPHDIQTVHKDTSEPGAEPQGIQSAHKGTTEPQDATSKPVTMAEDHIQEPIVKSEDVTSKQVPAAQAIMTELVAEDHKATIELVTGAQDVTMEQVPAAQEVTTELHTEPQAVGTKPVAIAQDTIPKQSPDVHKVTTDIGTGTHEVTTEQVPAAQDVTKKQTLESHQITTDIDTGAHNITTEPVKMTRDHTSEPAAIVEDATTKQVPETHIGAHEVTREPVSAAQEVMDVSMELAEAAAQGVTTEQLPAVKEVPTETVAAVEDRNTEQTTTAPEAMDVTVQPAEPDGQSAPTKTDAVAQEATRKPGDAAPEVSTEQVPAPQEAMDVAVELPEPATQCPPSEPVTAAQEVTTDRTGTTPEDMDVTMEPETETPIQTEGVATESAVPKTKELVATEEGVTPKPTRDGTNQEAASEDASMEVSAAPQDVSMEPQALVTIPEPTAALDMTMNPTNSGQNTSPKSVITAGEGVTLDHAASIDENRSIKQTIPQTVETVTAAERGEDTNDKTVSPEMPSQDITMAPETVSEESTTEAAAKVQDVAMTPVTGAQDVPMHTTEDQAVSLETVAAATPKEGQGAEVGENKSSVGENPVLQDGMDTPGATTQTADAAVAEDGTSSAKSAAEAAEQGTEVAQSAGTVPHKGVLSSYAFPAQETFLNDKSKFFSITYEQHVEIEGHLYIPIGVCYLENHETLCEDVLAYVPLDDDVTVFVDCVTTTLSEKWGLDLGLCRGQSLLTVGSAGAQIKAAAALFSQRYPRALRTFNNSVSLNTWLARSCTVTGIAESFIWVENLLQWVTEDAENQAKLHKTIMFVFQHDERKHGDLRRRLTRSQWEKSHDTLDFTVEVMEAVVLCLNDMKENSEVQAERTQAVNFLIVLQSFEFILILVIMKNILCLTKDMSQSLQGEAMEVYQTVNSLPALLSSLKDVATNIDAYFQIWYQEALEIGAKMQIGVDPAFQESIVCHYRDIVCRGAIDHSVNEITELWSSHVLSALRCLQVVPYVVSMVVGSCTDSDVFKMFQDDLPNWGSLQAELLKWREKWLRAMASQQPVPLGLLDTLRDSDKSFPNVETLLRLLLVLPCCKTEDSVRQGKMSLTEFQHQRSLLELYPL